MSRAVRIATREGLWTLERDQVFPVEALTGKSLTALALDGARAWALVDGRALWEGVDSGWRERATIDGPEATCLASTPNGLLIGTEEAHLLRFDGDRPVRVESFDSMDGRAAWYTPWGDPADVRSIAVARDGAVHVNVHVGGVARSRDGGRTWAPTVDIEVDVHQILAHPGRPDVVLAAAADGFGVSRDGGDSWRFVADGMHAHYLRAVAVSDDTVLVSASSGPGGRRAAIYRRRLDDDGAFERCTEGLPTWFGNNVDTGCLAAAGREVVCGTEDGRVFRSLDSGGHWELAAKGLPPVTGLSLS